MRRALFIITILAATTIQAQEPAGIDAAVESILANNATLKALRHETDAAKAEAHATNALPDPEVTFGYLWHGRKDVSVSQQFDWATITGRRRAATASADTLAEATYGMAAREVELRARLAYIGAVQGNALTRLLSVRLDRASRMAEIARRRLAAGTGRRADVASTATAKAKATGELAKAQADLDSRLAELAALNGGQAIAVSDTTFSSMPALYGDFQSWLASNGGELTAVAVSQAEASRAKAVASVGRAENMPQFSIGYMGEFTPNESYEGVTLGVSVPLWSARKKARQNTLTLRAAEQRHAATQIEARAEAEALFNRALTLGRVAAELHESLEQADDRALYVKAVEQGEMSAAEAIVAEEVYYDAAVAAIDAEAEYRAAVAEVWARVGR